MNDSDSCFLCLLYMQIFLNLGCGDMLVDQFDMLFRFLVGFVFMMWLVCLLLLYGVRL